MKKVVPYNTFSSSYKETIKIFYCLTSTIWLDIIGSCFEKCQNLYEEILKAKSWLAQNIYRGIKVHTRYYLGYLLRCTYLYSR